MNKKGFVEVFFLFVIFVAIAIGLVFYKNKTLARKMTETDQVADVQLTSHSVSPTISVSNDSVRYFKTYYLAQTRQLWGFATDGVYYGSEINNLGKLFTADLALIDERGYYYIVKDNTKYFVGSPKVYLTDNKKFFILLNPRGYGPGMADVYLKIINLEDQAVYDFSFTNTDRIENDDEEANLLDAVFPVGNTISEPEDGVVVISGDSLDILKINLKKMNIDFLVKE